MHLPGRLKVGTTLMVRMSQSSVCHGIHSHPIELSVNRLMVLNLGHLFSTPQKQDAIKKHVLGGTFYRASEVPTDIQQHILEGMNAS
jgi:hypothetical protein